MRAIMLVLQPKNEETGTFDGEHYRVLYLPDANLTVGKYDNHDYIHLNSKPDDIEMRRESAVEVRAIDIDFPDYQLFVDWARSTAEAEKCARRLFASLPISQ